MFLSYQARAMVQESWFPVIRRQVMSDWRGSEAHGRREFTSCRGAIALQAGVGGGVGQVGEKGTFPSIGRLRHELSRLSGPIDPVVPAHPGFRAT